MISDNDLYSLAVFLGSLAMLLIVLYHFLEVNAIDDNTPGTSSDKKISVKATMSESSKEKVQSGGK